MILITTPAPTASWTYVIAVCVVLLVLAAIYADTWRWKP